MRRVNFGGCDRAGERLVAGIVAAVGHAGRSSIAVGVVVELVLVVAVAALANIPPKRAKHRCGSFLALTTDGKSKTRVYVRTSQSTSCKTARSVISALWGPEERITRHGGPHDPSAYLTIQGFPGWTCTQGPGKNFCRHRGGHLVGYSARFTNVPD